MKAFLGKIEKVFANSDLQSTETTTPKNSDERRFSFLDYEINFSMKKRSQSSTEVKNTSKPCQPGPPPPPPPPRFTLNLSSQKSKYMYSGISFLNL